VYTTTLSKVITAIKPLNAELNPICHLLALLGAHHILYVSRIRVKLITLDSGLWNRAILWLQCFAGTGYFQLQGRWKWWSAFAYWSTMPWGHTGEKGQMNMNGLSISQGRVLGIHWTRAWVHPTASMHILAEHYVSAPWAMLQDMWDSLWQGLIILLFDLDRLLFVLKFIDSWQTVELPHQTCPELGWVVFVHSLAQN
jgi:hypothetical protein